MQTVGYSAMIREAFQGDKGLQGIVKKLPIERQFRLDNVKTVSAYRSTSPICLLPPVKVSLVHYECAACMRGDLQHIRGSFCYLKQRR